MIGAPYEFDRSPKVKDFPFFSKESQFTDDSIMTIAVAEAIIDVLHDAADDWTEHRLVTSMQKGDRKYPHAGYWVNFLWWLRNLRNKGGGIPTEKSKLELKLTKRSIRSASQRRICP